jgi:hypothetical protein
MSPQLEALLQALDRLADAPRPQSLQVADEYDELLKTVSEQINMRVELLDRAVRQRYPEWLRAQRKPTSLPPNA